MINRLLFIFPLFCLLLPLTAQEELKKQLVNTPDDKKIILYNDYVDNLDSSNITQIYYYSHQALLLLKQNNDNLQAARAFFNLGRVGVFLNDNKMAYDNFEEAYKLTSSPMELHAQSAYRLAQLTDQSSVNEILQFYRSAANTTKSKNLKDDAILGQVQTLLANRNYTQAEVLLDQLLQTNSSNGRAYLLKAAIRYQQKLFVQAKEFWNKALSFGLSEQNDRVAAEAYYGLALVNVEQRNNQEAIFNAEKAILLASRLKKDAFLVSVQDLLAETFLRIGQTNQAFNILKLRYDTEVSLLREQQQSTNLFFKNSLDLTAMQEQNDQLQKKLDDRSRAFFISLFIGAMAIISTVILLQLFRNKLVEEKTLSEAYEMLAKRTFKPATPLKNRLINLEARKDSFDLYRISFKNWTIKDQLLREYIFFTLEQQVQTFIPSGEIFASKTNDKNFFYLLTLDSSSNFNNFDTTYNLLWHEKTVTGEISIDSFHKRKESGGHSLNELFNEWNVNDFY